MKKKIIFGYLFGFITSLVLTVLALLVIVKFTIGNKSYVLNILDSDKYYEKLDAEIKEELSLHLLSSGFTDEVIEDVYSYDNLVHDVKSYIDNAYIGKLVTIDTSKIHENITENVNNFLKKSNGTYNKNEVASFIDDLVNIYSDEVMLYHFPDNVIKYIPKIIKYVNIGILITSLLFVMMLSLLAIISYQYYGSSIMASGLILLFIRLFIFERIDVENLLIITEKFSEELRVILANLENLFLIVAIGLFIIGLILIIIKSLCKSKKIKDEIVEI